MLPIQAEIKVHIGPINKKKKKKPRGAIPGINENATDYFIKK